MSRQASLDAVGMIALLRWQAELGAEEPIGDDPVNRYALPERPPWLAAPTQTQAAPEPERKPVPVPAVAPAEPGLDPVMVARELAASAGSLAELADAQGGYEHCELKKGARSFVFADGNPAARVMVIGEAPGNDEDRIGRPFVGAAGQLLDRMFAAIGLSRTSPDPATALYITNVMPWRPPQNREPTPEEISMMAPFLQRHVELAAPEILVLVGNTPCTAVLGKRGILSLRGKWTEALGRPVLPMTHPSYLLRTPIAKREAWADLLAIRARLDGKG